MTLLRSIKIAGDQVTADAGGRVRVSQLTTIFDGKILNEDLPVLFDNQGTGTGSFGSNKYTMTVAAGQYLVRQSTRYGVYFSGKSQLIECTFDNFHAQANVTKRVGYFSSSAVAPYDTTFDGFYLENDGTTIRLKIDRAGTNVLNAAINTWDNYDLISTYNWENFTVVLFDFLWLGGAVLRLFLKTDLGFVLCHTVNYSGTATNTFTLSPNQPVRYEIRSSGGAGTLRYICAQIATEGSINESGRTGSTSSSSGLVTYAVVGTRYPLIAIRKKTTHRDIGVRNISAQVHVKTNNDIVKYEIWLNLTTSAPLTFANNGYAVERALGNGVITVTGFPTNSKLLHTGFVSYGSTMPDDALELDYHSFLGMSINDTPDVAMLVVMPLTANIDIWGSMNYKEY